MKSTSRLFSRAGWALASAFGISMLAGDCNPDIVQDPTFRDWCGDSLCAWKLDVGHVARVPTWNEYDLGVSFTETPTQISQATTESGARCILFTSVADIDPAADVTIAVDFNSDGSFERTEQLGSANWQMVQTEITAPAEYQGITFALRKSGSGTAILAEMRIQSTTGCTAAPVSIPNGSLQFGEKCAETSECASGLVCHGAAKDKLCSQCSAAAPCAGGVKCSTRSVFFPNQCGPGDGLGKPGDPCISKSDCASGVCEGATPVALGSEAGACDLEAPLGTTNPSNCQWYAVRGGTCR